MDLLKPKRGKKEQIGKQKEFETRVTESMKDPGVSEVIAAILLIGVVVGAMAVVGVMVTQNIIPTKIPVMDFEACIKEHTTLYLYHLGGDALKPGEKNPDFYVNLLDENDNKIKSINLMPWIKDSWSSGDILSINTELHPINDPVTRKVQIVTLDGTGETLIEWAEIGSCYGLGGFGPGPGCLGRVFAGFDAVPKTGPKILSVTFTDKSSYDDPHYPVTYREWNFGDGTPISNEVNPSHPFTNDGIYIVRLRVYNECGSDEVAHPITVGEGLCPPVTAAFETVPNPPVITGPGVTGLDVTFTDKSEPSDNITRWEWDFGDNQTYSGKIPQIHHYPRGVYWASLTVYNGCGEWDSDSIMVSVLNEDDCFLSPEFTYKILSGPIPLVVDFTDTSSTRGWIVKRHWDFGDGATSDSGDGIHADSEATVQHTYNTPGRHTISLTVTNSCGMKGETSHIIDACPTPIASFIYEITDFIDFTVRFTDTSDGGGDNTDIMRWLWDFGDGKVSILQNPLHVYAGEPKPLNVNLTVWNDCGMSNTTRRLVDPTCPPIVAGMNAAPATGMPGILVYFTDLSDPVDNITSWRWIFGDGKSYYTTDLSARNTTHPYDRIGTFYATLMIENKCGQAFVNTKIVTVASPAIISGHLWNDRNLNQIPDNNELNLTDWRVDLEERVGNDWVWVATQNTDSNGNYRFSFNAVNGIYRVKEFLKTDVLWKATYAYFSDAKTESGYVVSGAILIQTTREYLDVGFGNVDWHSSSMQFPDRFKYGETDGGTSWTDRTTNDGEYWDYTTSFDANPNRLYNPENMKTNSKPSYVYYQVPPYSQWGDSAFTVTPGFYMQYIIIVASGGLPPISKTYWLKYWIYDGKRTDGVTFSVPDNSHYTANKTMLYFVRNDTPWSSIYVPQEDALIPYSKSSYLEVHFTGTSDKDMKANLIKPVNSGPPAIPFALTWKPAYGYYIGNWNNTPYENQSATLEVRVDRGPTYPTINRYYNTERRVRVDWEWVNPVIITPTDKSVVSGDVTINASVTGKNRDVTNVTLIVEDKNKYPMAWDSVRDVFTKKIDMEPFSGKKVKLIVRASPLSNRGKMIDSEPVYVTVLSKKPLVANFTADPWVGNATLEVGFTDISSGGPNFWNWNFGDGHSSSLQNPFNSYSSPGNYAVTLQVKNATGISDSVSKWVNVTGRMHDVVLLTSRNGTLQQGGIQSWRNMGDIASITVNGIAYPLLPNDRIQMDLLSDEKNARLFMAGVFSIYNVSDTSLTINGNEVARGPSTQINVPDFINYHSNMRLTALSNKTAFVSLVWDGVPIPVDWRQSLDLFDLMPTNGRSMDLNVSPGQVFFSGKASNYVLI